MNDYNPNAKIASHNVFVIGDVTISSNFDNGNLSAAESTGIPWEYNLRVAPDNMGMPISGKHCGHFHFVISGGNMSIGTVLKFHILNVSPHSSLYKFDMRPVVRCNATNQKWVRLKQAVQFNKAEDVGQLHFEYHVERENDKIYFCFTYPYTYEMIQHDMLQLDKLIVNINYNHTDSIYCNREVITKTPDGRNIDFITISNCDGINMNQREPVLNGLFPEEACKMNDRDMDMLNMIHTTIHSNTDSINTATNNNKIKTSTRPNSKSKHRVDLNTIHQNNIKHMIDSGCIQKRPYIFPNKEIAFISARVHPGEVPAQHTFKGILDFLLHPTDIRAIELRKRYVFKLIPMLNPDGVYRGHFRMDQFHQNLNRYYTNPDPIYQPSIFAVKTVLDLYALEYKKLAFYLDLHAHASKRGCFIYGNVINDIEDQLQNQLLCSLISLNTPHFDYNGCLFSREHMTRVDPCDQAKGLTAEGSGRVAIYLAYGLIHSYTLECNYNMSKYTNEICNMNNAHLLGCDDPTPVAPFNQLNYEKYTPSSYACVGRACVLALLDIRKHNPCSRLINSSAKTIERLREIILNEIKQRKEYRGLAFKRRSKSIKVSQSEKGKNSSSGPGSLLRDAEDLRWKMTSDSVPNGAIVIKEGRKKTNTTNSNSGSGRSNPSNINTSTSTGAGTGTGSSNKQTTNTVPSRPEVEKSSNMGYNGRKSNPLGRNPSDGMLLVLDPSTDKTIKLKGSKVDGTKQNETLQGSYVTTTTNNNINIIKPLPTPIYSPIASHKKREMEKEHSNVGSASSYNIMQPSVNVNGNGHGNGLNDFVINGTNPLVNNHNNIGTVLTSTSVPSTAYSDSMTHHTHNTSPNSDSSKKSPTTGYNVNALSMSIKKVKSQKDFKSYMTTTSTTSGNNNNITSYSNTSTNSTLNVTLSPSSSRKTTNLTPINIRILNDCLPNIPTTTNSVNSSPPQLNLNEQPNMFPPLNGNCNMPNNGSISNVPNAISHTGNMAMYMHSTNHTHSHSNVVITNNQ